MAILKQNTINGEKPEFGNPKHIRFVKRLSAIRAGELPIVEDSDFRIVCRYDYKSCIRNCTCSKLKADFNCINCDKKHQIVTSDKIVNSPIRCTCGFTYSELDDEYWNSWFLISDNSSDDHL